MQFAQPLVRGRLILRYKRFLADVTLDTGADVTAHCPNPGAMTGLAEPGTPVWLEPNDNPKRKLRHGWRLVELAGGGFAGIDTGVPNRVVGEALAARRIPALAPYSHIRPEVRYGEKSRVDFLATGDGLPDFYLEVKNVHLVRQPGLAEFPDCVTKRGARHLAELARMVRAGHRAAVLYCVQYTGLTRFALADDIDPGYAAAAASAAAAGVEMLVHGCEIDTAGIRLAGPLPGSARC